MTFLIILLVLIGLAYVFEKVYRNINIEKYSPKWEYFTKAMLYGVIMVFTLFYKKATISEVSALEWAIFAVSATEGFGNYINYIKEVEKEKLHKNKVNKIINRK